MYYYYVLSDGNFFGCNSITTKFLLLCALSECLSTARDYPSEYRVKNMVHVYEMKKKGLEWFSRPPARHKKRPMETVLCMRPQQPKSQFTAVVAL